MHPVAQVLRDPYAWSTGKTFWKQFYANIFGSRGFACAEIIHDDKMRPVQLIPYPSTDVTPFLDEEHGLVFVITLKNGKQKVIEYWRAFYVPFFTYNGWEPVNIIQLHRETISGNIAQQNLQNSFTNNKTHLGGVLEYPDKKLNEKQLERVRRTFAEKHKNGDIGILEDGMKYTPFGMKLVDAQWIETRQYGIDDIARIYGVPTWMLANNDPTYNNIEHQNLAFLKYTMEEPLIAVEQEADKKLFLEDEKPFFHVKHNVDALLRTDFESRQKGYSMAIENGTMNPDEARALEDRNPQPEETGQQFYHNQNSIPVGTDLTPEEVDRALQLKEKGGLNGKFEEVLNAL